MDDINDEAGYLQHTCDQLEATNRQQRRTVLSVWYAKDIGWLLEIARCSEVMDTEIDYCPYCGTKLGRV